MVQWSCRVRLALACVVLVGCGGGSSSDAAEAPPPAASAPPAANTPPQPVIVSPADGASFRAGDTLALSFAASDAQDGALAAAQLEWWIELHHDSHSHPFQLPSRGNSAAVAIPARGETSDNIFYRVSLRATDSAGASATVTRDVIPQKARVTLATQPTGLALTLDGQPVSGPSSFTGVVGIERDLGAAAEQIANGRRWRFASWNSGRAATHTITTPAADTTYTATFNDAGPATNQPPTVTLTAPASTTVNTAITLNATAADSDGSISNVQFFAGATALGSDTAAPFSLAWTPTTPGSFNLTARATDNSGNSTTSAAVSLTVNPPSSPGDTQAPSITLTSPGALADGLTGTVTLAASASDNVGVASVEFEVDGVSVAAPDTAAPYQASITTSQYAAGQHHVRARARDAAGNLSPWARATVRFGGTSNRPQGFTVNDNWLSGFDNATGLAQTPDGRLLITLQDGAVRVVKNGVLLATPFVQLSGLDTNGERGLIGVAIDPNFTNNGYVYLYYTTTAGGAHNRISRFTASGDVAAAGETVLVNLPNLSSALIHNGGGMQFGADGHLYVGVGENSTPALAQDRSSVFGKMLRFNADGSIPSDNPFYATQNGLARAVWATGLRNPFSFAIQPGSGRLHINDVGQETWEEINLGAAGANYGWPGSEGPDNLGAGLTGPLFTYKHSAASPAGSGPGGFIVGFAVVGGVFHPGSAPFPAGYRGSYYFSDFTTGEIFRMDLANGNEVSTFARISTGIVGMLVGNDGALYVLRNIGISRISAP
jgi:glucose/arabinose dehydrogenase